MKNKSVAPVTSKELITVVKLLNKRISLLEKHLVNDIEGKFVISSENLALYIIYSPGKSIKFIRSVYEATMYKDYKSAKLSAIYIEKRYSPKNERLFPLFVMRVKEILK
jgi:hypothetical protein